MKQLFLKSLLWTIQTTGAAVAGLIRFLTCTPMMFLWTGFWLTSFVLDVLTAKWGWVPLDVVMILANFLILFSRKSSAPTEAADKTSEARDAIGVLVPQIVTAFRDDDAERANQLVQELDAFEFPNEDARRVTMALIRFEKHEMALRKLATSVTELSAEAQAVVDRIRERTVRLIPNDPPATIKVQDLPAKRTRKPKLNIVKGENQ